MTGLELLAGVAILNMCSEKEGYRDQKARERDEAAALAARGPSEPLSPLDIFFQILFWILFIPLWIASLCCFSWVGLLLTPLTFILSVILAGIVMIPFALLGALLDAMANPKARTPRPVVNSSPQARPIYCHAPPASMRAQQALDAAERKQLVSMGACIPARLLAT